MFDPVLVEYALQIDGRAKLPLARWWIGRRHNVLFGDTAINVRQTINDENKRLLLIIIYEIALRQVVDHDGSRARPSPHNQPMETQTTGSQMTRNTS
jgi:hypothetical protein